MNTTAFVYSRKFIDRDEFIVSGKEAKTLRDRHLQTKFYAASDLSEPLIVVCY